MAIVEKLPEVTFVNFLWTTGQPDEVWGPVALQKCFFFVGDFGLNPRWRPDDPTCEDSGKDVSLQDVNKSIDELSIHVHRRAW